ncbi:hypothetical protein LTR35_000134 [Friedmanniomyces endolithicus]|uniref:WW domain-containing protein n=1 Tax=Friedmanniomyces endolithicus TaxID=329885 RepID=A0AAN6FLM4_9PEZI|nr:hypothetical protein LTS00_008778 [Friedmanniomyces endolithicus]KAK0293530.1 hypothetical protein LTR35_000134 [Friedmanniomyces endolithicus]KAK0318893.1 hypothetical protein LTR82_009993 [Friedmanniomyces endolithicus]KAK0997327.1 hypothetical protein LTR54_009787 [Friedmanniomyces endolithicus]
MSGQNIPNEPPPSYSSATGSSKPQTSNYNAGRTDNSHLGVPGASSSSHQIMPTDRRRSMEDEMRPLPKGWVRSFDPHSSHHFYVDTTKEPPQSIWVHPYDDDQYLSTLSSSERERVEQESFGRGHSPSKADILAGHTDDEDDDHHASGASSSSGAHYAAELPPRPADNGKKSFGRKLKDKMTGMTHEEREVERQKRAAEEKVIFERHQRIRAAMQKATETGQPQLIGKDKDGKDLYIEPPSYQGGGGYPGSGYGYNPYSSSGGMYTAPNSRYVRPAYPYSRPYGGGYGGGYGMPLGLGLGGGLLGGMMLGDMMGGGMGMGGMGMGGMGFGGGGF